MDWLLLVCDPGSNRINNTDFREQRGARHTGQDTNIKPLNQSKELGVRCMWWGMACHDVRSFYSLLDTHTHEHIKGIREIAIELAWGGE